MCEHTQKGRATKTRRLSVHAVSVNKMPRFMVQLSVPRVFVHVRARANRSVQTLHEGHSLRSIRDWLRHVWNPA